MHLVAANSATRHDLTFAPDLEAVRRGTEDGRFLGDAEAACWLNRHALPLIRRKGLVAYLRSQEDLLPAWRLGIPEQRQPSEDLIILGLCRAQHRVFGYDGLYWCALAEFDAFSDVNFTKSANQYRECSLTKRLPPYRQQAGWELFGGDLERLAPLLVCTDELPIRLLGKTAREHRELFGGH